MIHREKPCPIQSPSALLRGLLRSPRILPPTLEQQSCTCDTDLQVCLCWRWAFFPQMSANPIELQLSNFSAWGKQSRSGLSPPPHPPPTPLLGPPKTYIIRTHSVDLCLSFSNVRGTAGATSCILLSACDKYGSFAPGASTWRIDGAFS